MHFDARDLDSDRFTSPGWQAAFERAASASLELETALRRLPQKPKSRNNTKPWKNLVGGLSDRGIHPFSAYPDPRPRKLDPGRSHCGGGFRSVTYPSLRSLLKSSCYEELRLPSRNAVWVFFEQEPGSVSPPLRTPTGYAVVWLRERMDPRHPLRLDELSHRKGLRQMASELEFGARWQQAARDARVR